MAETNIKLEVMDGVGIITMDRPESRNALTPDMVDEMGEAIKACNIRRSRGNAHWQRPCVLFRGRCKSFC